MLDALRHIVQDMDAAPSFRVALDMIVARVSMILDVEVCSIFLRDRAGRFHFVANEGLNTDLVGQLSLAANEGLVGLVAERAEPINLEDASSHPRFHAVAGLQEDPYGAFLGVPIIHVREVLGVLILQDREVRAYDENEVAFLVTLAAQIAGRVARAEATGNIKGLLPDAGETAESRFRGIPGVPGIGIGPAYVALPTARLELVRERTAANTHAEIELFENAIGHTRADIERINEQMAENLGPEERELFDAYLHMLDALAEDVCERIREGQWAQGALKRTIFEV